MNYQFQDEVADLKAGPGLGLRGQINSGPRPI